MKVLVIPNVHLKPYMFRNAHTLMERGIAENVVCLMDITDDWNQQYNVALYEETYDEAISFAKKYSNIRMYKPRKILQVVGHTPVDMIEKKGSIINLKDNPYGFTGRESQLYKCVGYEDKKLAPFLEYMGSRACG